MEVNEERAYGLVAVLVAGCGGLLLGGAVSWWAFGVPRGVDLAADNGNTADWVAAVGTWIIGLAAAYYAHQSHLQRLDEIREKRLADFERKDAFLSGAVLSGLHIRSVADDIESFLELSEDSRYVLQLRDLMERLEENVVDVKFSDETLAAFPSKAVTKLAAINNRAEGLRRLMKSVSGYLDGTLLKVRPPGDDVLLTDADNKMLRNMLEVAKGIREIYDEYFDLLVDAKVRAEFEVERLRRV